MVRGLKILAIGATGAFGLLGGCASAPMSQSADSDSQSEVTVTQVEGAWPQEGEIGDTLAVIQEGGVISGLELTLGGSGTESCAPKIFQASVKNDSLFVTLEEPNEGPCTEDLLPYTWVLGVPNADNLERVVIENSEHELIEEFIFEGEL